ncbi:2TM domain-containing protein [Rasiella rasia]|uniref:2TM domain-containing protein n=2 Tax=Rasiella rasia TaxID=2744027 RepID=A0A6G6GT04_9FLAO|nr:2TM domain-containing protein [Rasiella rasia]
MNTSDKEKFERAKKQVAEIKGFYVHLSIYLFVNLILLLIAFGLFSDGFFSMHMPHWGHFTTPFFWGIGLFFHGLKVFGHKMKFLKNWEDRKIKEYIDREERDFEKFN